MKRLFYLHKRKNGIYYAVMFSKNGEWLATRSTRSKNPGIANNVVAEWFSKGRNEKTASPPETVLQAETEERILRLVRSPDLTEEGAARILSALHERGLIADNPLKGRQDAASFIPFLLNFWDYEESKYIRDKLAHGNKITRIYCRRCQQAVEKHWKPSFQDRELPGITRRDISDFASALYKAGLKPKTIKNIELTGTKALKWAFEEGLIPTDPTVGISKFSGGKTNRDILTGKEISAVFTRQWSDRRAFAASLVASICGLRSGEIRALRKEDIGEGLINIMHSWNDLDGLKCPKNGDPRYTPLPAELKKMLLALLAENPHKDRENPFIFYSENPDKPCSAELFRRGFRRVCKEINENPEGWTETAADACGPGTLWLVKAEKGKPWEKPEPADFAALDTERYEYRYKRSDFPPETPVYIDLARRKLDIHSLRHYNASCLADETTADKVARLSGHKSKAMAELYQKHHTKKLAEDMLHFTREAFTPILAIIGK